MLDIKKLVAAIQGASADKSVNITINVMNTDGDVVVPATVEDAPVMPDTDFTVGQRVYICHIKKDGTGTKHTKGTVESILNNDDKGWYTRIVGDNGCHYRTGLKLNEERLGSKVIALLDSSDRIVD